MADREVRQAKRHAQAKAESFWRQTNEAAQSVRAHAPRPAQTTAVVERQGQGQRRAQGVVA